MNKVRGLLQAIGFLTLGLLAVYGALAFAGGAGPLPGALQARAQEPEGQPPVETLALPTPQIPTTVNYQGFVRNPDGSLANGTFNVTARIYDAASAGNQKYEIALGSVLVRDGLFNIILGDKDKDGKDKPLGGTFSQSPLYIGIDLGQGELVPRQRIHAVPVAQLADIANRAASADTLVANAPAQSIKALTATTVTATSVTAAKITDVTALKVKRNYKMFGVDGKTSGELPLGPWDFCALSGHQNGGHTNCIVAPAGKGDWVFQGTWSKLPNAKEEWTLFAWKSGDWDVVKCKAICVNFGD